MLHPIPHKPPSGDPVVELRGVTCGYNGHPVLHDVDLKLMPGDFVGLLGPSGSGKTTLLRAILGSVDLYGGRVLVQGKATANGKPRIGYVPQLKTIDWNFPVTVEETVMMGLTMSNPFFPWNKAKDRKLVHPHARTPENRGPPQATHPPALRRTAAARLPRPCAGQQPQPPPPRRTHNRHRHQDPGRVPPPPPRTQPPGRHHSNDHPPD